MDRQTLRGLAARPGTEVHVQGVDVSAPSALAKVHASRATSTAAIRATGRHARRLGRGAAPQADPEVRKRRKRSGSDTYARGGELRACTGMHIRKPAPPHLQYHYDHARRRLPAPWSSTVTRTLRSNRRAEPRSGNYCGRKRIGSAEYIAYALASENIALTHGISARQILRHGELENFVRLKRRRLWYESPARAGVAHTQ